MLRQRFVSACVSKRIWSGREYSSLIRNPRLNVKVIPTSSTCCTSWRQQHRASFVTITKTKSSDPPIEIKGAVEHATVSTPPSVEATDANDTLHITESCWARIRHLTRDQPDAYLRLFVDAGGCSGFTYQFELDTEVPDAAEDVIFTDNNNDARLIVDTASLGFLQGATIDYVQEMIKSAFAVTENPQSESACGCGSSFALKNFAANSVTD